MSDTQTKKKAAAKPAQHPKYKEMITAAIESLKERNGSSRQAIAKYIKENYNVGDSCDVHIKVELKRLVASNVLVHTKGTGASGSFKVNKKLQEKPKKKATPKKPAAKKAKTAAAKKTKKPSAKKPPQKKKPKKPAKKTAVKKATKTSKKKPTAKKSKK